jgi:hypothetical protein
VERPNERTGLSFKITAGFSRATNLLSKSLGLVTVFFQREKCKSRGRVKDTLLRGGRKSIVCEKVPRLRPLVLLVRIK